MTYTLLLLLILAGSVAALPRSERAAGAIGASAALVTGAILTLTEAGMAIAPERWLFAVALVLAILNCVVGKVEADLKSQKWELR